MYFFQKRKKKKKKKDSSPAYSFLSKLWSRGTTLLNKFLGPVANTDAAATNQQSPERYIISGIIINVYRGKAVGVVLEYNHNQLLQLCMARTAWSESDQAVRTVHSCNSFVDRT